MRPASNRSWPAGTGVCGVKAGIECDTCLAQRGLDRHRVRVVAERARVQVVIAAPSIELLQVVAGADGGGGQPQAVVEHTDAILMLWYVELAGGECGSAWREIAPHIRAKAHEQVFPFLTTIYLYALERAGKFDGNLRRDDLAFDSPYNTYRYAGLPPGPIAAPGKASLEAAANPADVSYIYFVSRNDGSHAFASTLEEHNRNVHQWQVLYHREKRLRQQ